MTEPNRLSVIITAFDKVHQRIATLTAERDRLAAENEMLTRALKSERAYALELLGSMNRETSSMNKEMTRDDYTT